MKGDHLLGLVGLFISAFFIVAVRSWSSGESFILELLDFQVESKLWVFVDGTLAGVAACIIYFVVLRNGPDNA